MNLYKHKIPQIGEDFYTIFKDKNITVKKIVSSDIVEDKLYIQEQNEYVFVIKGSAILGVDNKKKTLNSGDSIFLKAKTPHRILSVQKGTIWLAIYYI
jgi:cupin 2 domain-containing protein